MGLSMNLGVRPFWCAFAAMSPLFAVVLLSQYQLTTDSNAKRIDLPGLTPKSHGAELHR